MKRSNKIWLSILLAAVVIVSVRAYFLLVAKLIKTSGELQETRVQLSQAQKDSQLLQDDLLATREQLQKIKAELKGTQRELRLVNSRLGSMEKDNFALQEEKARLETRLHSLLELKKAIRQVKVEHHQQRAQEYFVRKESQKKIDAQRLAQGNRGFLVKNGQPIYQPKVTIEVKPE